VGALPSFQSPGASNEYDADYGYSSYGGDSDGGFVPYESSYVPPPNSGSSSGYDLDAPDFGNVPSASQALSGAKNQLNDAMPSSMQIQQTIDALGIYQGNSKGGVNPFINHRLEPVFEPLSSEWEVDKDSFPSLHDVPKTPDNLKRSRVISERVGRFGNFIPTYQHAPTNSFIDQKNSEKDSMLSEHELIEYRRSIQRKTQVEVDNINEDNLEESAEDIAQPLDKEEEVILSDDSKNDVKTGSDKPIIVFNVIESILNDAVTSYELEENTISPDSKKEKRPAIKERDKNIKKVKDFYLKPSRYGKRRNPVE